MMRRIGARLRAVLLLAALSGLVMAGAAIPAHAVQAACENVTLTLATTPGGAPQAVSGTLCTPAGNAHVTRVDVLVHGASYNRSYWDWPVQPATYSYVQHTLQSGRATFAYDRLGAGQSSHPLSTLVTTSADAYLLHGVISWLRGAGYSTVDVIGHSFGSVVAVDEAAGFHDVDKLVVTGLLHSQGPGLGTVAATFYPADLDPQFLLSGLDTGYLTTLPGTRASSFYSASADPTVVAYDETHKDVISGTELGAGVAESQVLPALNASSLVTAQVLVLDGSQDSIFCGLYVDCADPAAVLAVESAYYPAAASVAVMMVPGTGHDVALHPSALTSFGAIDAWITSG